MPGYRSLRVALFLITAGCAGCGREAPSEVPPSSVRFVRERVTVRPSERRTAVTGVYWFRNESGDTTDIAMRYPFPVDRYHLAPFRIRAWEVRGDVHRPLGFTPGPTWIEWHLSFRPREEKAIRIEYEQEIRRRHAIYIVTTTREWRRPLEKAEFAFRVPRSLASATPSFGPTRVEEIGDTTVYYLEATQFMPDSDLSITWQ